MNMELISFTEAENIAAYAEGDMTALCEFLSDKTAITAELKKRTEKIAGLIGDLTTEAGRKAYRAEIKPYKKTCTDFEKNLKLVKKTVSDWPKRLDETSRATRAYYEPVFDKLEAPFAELKAQEELAQKWWKKEGIPFDKFGLMQLLETTQNTEPSKHSTAAEIADFGKYKIEYIATIEKSIATIETAEKAEQERKEAQAKEAERLRLQAAEQAKIAEEQRKQQAAIEAEQKRIAAEAAELEKQKQAAVNPASAGSNPPDKASTGAPSAMPPPDFVQEAVWGEIEVAIKNTITSVDAPTAMASAIAQLIRRAIVLGQIPHVTANYGEAADV